MVVMLEGKDDEIKSYNDSAAWVLKQSTSGRVEHAAAGRLDTGEPVLAVARGACLELWQFSSVLKTQAGSQQRLCSQPIHGRAVSLQTLEGCSFLLLTDSVGSQTTGAVPVTDFSTDRWCLVVLVYSPSFKSFIAVQHIPIPHLLPAWPQSDKSHVRHGPGKITVSSCGRYIAVLAHNRVLLFRRSHLSPHHALSTKLHDYKAALEAGAYACSRTVGLPRESNCSSLGVLDSTPAERWLCGPEGLEGSPGIGVDIAFLGPSVQSDVTLAALKLIPGGGGSHGVVMFLHYCPDLHTCEMSLDKHWLASSGLGTPCAIRPVPGGYHGSQSLRGAMFIVGTRSTMFCNEACTLRLKEDEERIAAQLQGTWREPAPASDDFGQEQLLLSPSCSEELGDLGLEPMQAELQAPHPQDQQQQQAIVDPGATEGSITAAAVAPLSAPVTSRGLVSAWTTLQPESSCTGSSREGHQVTQQPQQHVLLVTSGSHMVAVTPGYSDRLALNSSVVQLPPGIRPLSHLIPLPEGFQKQPGCHAMLIAIEEDGDMLVLAVKQQQQPNQQLGHERQTPAVLHLQVQVLARHYMAGSVKAAVCGAQASALLGAPPGVVPAVVTASCTTRTPSTGSTAGPLQQDSDKLPVSSPSQHVASQTEPRANSGAPSQGSAMSAGSLLVQQPGHHAVRCLSATPPGSLPPAEAVWPVSYAPDEAHHSALVLSFTSATRALQLRPGGGMRDVSEELGVEQEEKTVCAATVAPGLLAQVTPTCVRLCSMALLDDDEQDNSDSEGAHVQGLTTAAAGHALSVPAGPQLSASQAGLPEGNNQAGSGSVTRRRPRARSWSVTAAAGEERQGITHAPGAAAGGLTSRGSRPKNGFPARKPPLPAGAGAGAGPAGGVVVNTAESPQVPPLPVPIHPHASLEAALNQLEVASSTDRSTSCATAPGSAAQAGPGDMADDAQSPPAKPSGLQGWGVFHQQVLEEVGDAMSCDEGSLVCSQGEGPSSSKVQRSGLLPHTRRQRTSRDGSGWHVAWQPGPCHQAQGGSATTAASAQPPAILAATCCPGVVAVSLRQARSVEMLAVQSEQEGEGLLTSRASDTGSGSARKRGRQAWRLRHVGSMSVPDEVSCMQILPMPQDGHSSSYRLLVGHHMPGIVMYQFGLPATTGLRCVVVSSISTWDTLSPLLMPGCSPAELVPESVLLLPQPTDGSHGSSSTRNVRWLAGCRQGSVTLQEWDSSDNSVHTHFHIQPSSTPLTLVPLQQTSIQGIQPGGAAHGSCSNGTRGRQQHADEEVQHVLALDGVRCFMLRVSLGRSPSLSAELLALPDTAKACALQAPGSISPPRHPHPQQTATRGSEASSQHLVVGLGSDGSWHLTSLSPDTQQEAAPLGGPAWPPAVSQPPQHQLHSGQKDGTQVQEEPNTSAPAASTCQPSTGTHAVEANKDQQGGSEPTPSHLLVHTRTRSLAVLSCHTLPPDTHPTQSKAAPQASKKAAGAAAKPPKQQGTLSLVDPHTGSTRGSFSFPLGSTPLCATSWVAHTVRTEAPRAVPLNITPCQADSGRGSPAGGVHQDPGANIAATVAASAAALAAAAAAVQAMQRVVDGARLAHGSALSAHPLALLDEDRDSEVADTPGSAREQQQQQPPLEAGASGAGAGGEAAVAEPAAGDGVAGGADAEGTQLLRDWILQGQENQASPNLQGEQQQQGEGLLGGPDADMTPAVAGYTPAPGFGILAAKTETQAGAQPAVLRCGSSSLDLLPPQLLGEFSQRLGLSSDQPKASSSTQELLVVGTRTGRGQGGIHVLRVLEAPLNSKPSPTGPFKQHLPGPSTLNSSSAFTSCQHQLVAAEVGSEQTQQSLQVEQLSHICCPAPVTAVRPLNASHILAAVGPRLACLELQGCKVVKKVWIGTPRAVTHLAALCVGKNQHVVAAADGDTFVGLYWLDLEPKEQMQHVVTAAVFKALACEPRMRAVTALALVRASSSSSPSSPAQPLPAEAPTPGSSLVGEEAAENARLVIADRDGQVSVLRLPPATKSPACNLQLVCTAVLGDVCVSMQPCLLPDPQGISSSQLCSRNQQGTPSLQLVGKSGATYMLRPAAVGASHGVVTGLGSSNTGGVGGGAYRGTGALLDALQQAATQHPALAPVSGTAHTRKHRAGVAGRQAQQLGQDPAAIRVMADGDVLEHFLRLPRVEQLSIVKALQDEQPNLLGPALRDGLGQQERALLWLRQVVQESVACI